MNVTHGGDNFRGPSRPPTRSACRITILRHYLWQTISWMLIFPCLALGHSPENVTSAESLPQEVMHSLLSTPLGKTLPALPYSINQVQT